MLKQFKQIEYSNNMKIQTIPQFKRFKQFEYSHNSEYSEFSEPTLNSEYSDNSGLLVELFGLS